MFLVGLSGKLILHATRNRGCVALGKIANDVEFIRVIRLYIYFILHNEQSHFYMISISGSNSFLLSVFSNNSISIALESHPWLTKHHFPIIPFLYK